MGTTTKASNPKKANKDKAKLRMSSPKQKADAKAAAKGASKKSNTARPEKGSILLSSSSNFLTHSRKPDTC
jgi:hypothetical protein